MERMSYPTYSEIKKLDKKLYNKRMEVYDRVYVLEEENKRLEEENKRLEEENKKLKEDNRFLTKISKEYMEKENIVEVTEFTELYKDDLEEENKKLKKYYDRDKEELMESCYSLAKENDELREENKNLKKEVERLQKVLYTITGSRDDGEPDLYEDVEGDLC